MTTSWPISACHLNTGMHTLLRTLHQYKEGIFQHSIADISDAKLIFPLPLSINTKEIFNQHWYSIGSILDKYNIGSILCPDISNISNNVFLLFIYKPVVLLIVVIILN